MKDYFKLSGLVTFIFVILKFTGNLDWSWLWVLSPLLISGFVFLVTLAGLVYLGAVNRGEFDAILKRI